MRCAMTMTGEFFRSDCVIFLFFFFRFWVAYSVRHGHRYIRWERCWTLVCFVAVFALIRTHNENDDSSTSTPSTCFYSSIHLIGFLCLIRISHSWNLKFWNEQQFEWKIEDGKVWVRLAMILTFSHRLVWMKLLILQISYILTDLWQTLIFFTVDVHRGSLHLHQIIKQVGNCSSYLKWASSSCGYSRLLPSNRNIP